MARKYGTNRDVVKAFVQGESYPYENSTESVSHEDGILKSYNAPICIQRKDGMFIINGDRFSNTTSHHQAELQNELRGFESFTTSFSALENFVGGVSTISVTYSRHGLFTWRLQHEVEIVDHTKDFHVAYFPSLDRFKDIDGGTYTWEELPQGAEIRYRYDNSLDKTIPTEAHMAASSVFKYGDYYALASMDERQFFVSVLSRPVDSVSDAFYSLKPEEVEEAESKGMETYRQGEWFFIPHLVGKEAREQYNQMESEFKLIGQDGGNPHIATRGEWVKKGVAEVSGGVKHEEHGTCQLSKSNDPIIFVAVENTALISYSAQGRVD